MHLKLDFKRKYSDEEAPKGKLIAIGGGEDKTKRKEVLSRVLQEIRGKDSILEIITTASSIPEKVGQKYIRAFAKLGCKKVGVIHIEKPEQADKEEYLERIAKAEGVMFSGGDQLRLSKAFNETKFLELLHKKYHEEDFVIAGTSAGAMAMSDVMIFRGSSSEALLKGEIKIMKGLSFLENVIIDTHFVKRGRFGRLMQAIAVNPNNIGVGLGEDTGVIIYEGNIMETIGSGLVIIVDGKEIKYSNINELTHGAPISIEHLVLHVLAKGNSYIIKERSFSAVTAAMD